MILPRNIRFRDAPDYLGIDKNELDALRRRFLSKVDVTDTISCWVWNGSRDRSSKRNCLTYGQLRIREKKVQAHRASWLLFKGNIPNGLCVLHKCDNPICVNPSHLFLGTIGDNNNDMRRKGRTRHHSKLTIAQIQEIRDSKFTQAELSKLYGVSQPAISQIKGGKTWAA